jgi:hypothetical protein
MPAMKITTEDILNKYRLAGAARRLSRLLTNSVINRLNELV